MHPDESRRRSALHLAIRVQRLHGLVEHHTPGVARVVKTLLRRCQRQIQCGAHLALAQLIQIEKPGDGPECLCQRSDRQVNCGDLLLA